MYTDIRVKAHNIFIEIIISSQHSAVLSITSQTKLARILLIEVSVLFNT